MLAYLNRIRGLDKARSPIASQTVRRVLCGLPFGVWAGVVALPLGLLYSLLIGFLVTLATFGAFTDGHGNQMDLAKSDETNENVNLWDKIFGKEGFKAEFLGLTASGLLVAIPTSIALALIGHYVASISFLIVPGMGKALAYWVAQKINFKFPSLWANGNDDLSRNTDGGEVLWGFVLDIGLVLSIILVLLL